MKMLEPDESTKKHFEEAGLLIRRSVNSDFDPIKNIMIKIFEELCPALSKWYSEHPDSFRGQFFGPENQDPGRRVFYTFQKNFGIIGSSGLIQKDPLIQPYVGELVSVYLLPEFRNYGLGKMAVIDLIGKARKLNFSEIYLTTRKEFSVAIKLYEKLGFKQAREQKYNNEKSISLELIF